METIEKPLSLSQAGRLIGVTGQRVRQLIAEGRLPCVRTPLGRIVAERDVLDLIAERAGQRARAS